MYVFLLLLMLHRFLPVFSPKSFTVPALTVRTWVHAVLVFICGVRWPPGVLHCLEVSVRLSRVAWDL